MFKVTPKSNEADKLKKSQSNSGSFHRKEQPRCVKDLGPSPSTLRLNSDIFGQNSWGGSYGISFGTQCLHNRVAFRSCLQETQNMAKNTSNSYDTLPFGCVFFRGPPKCWFSFWFPFKTTKKGVPSNKDPHFGPFKLTLARPWPQPKITQLGGIQGSHGIEWVER